MKQIWQKRIELARDNELIAYTLYHYKNEVEWGTQAVKIDWDYNYLHIQKYDCDGERIGNGEDIISLSHDAGNETTKAITSDRII